MKEKKEKKPMHPIWFLIIGIIILIVPAAVYLGFLIPKLTAEYNILLASGGVIGSGGIAATSLIPEKAKFGTLYKTASKSFTLLAVITVVQNFLPQILGLIATVLVSYIIFMIMKELWKNGREKRNALYIAKEVARSTTEATK